MCVDVVFVTLVFSAICRGRSAKHLEVLEAVYICVSKPSLCVQKSKISLSLLTSLST